METESDAFVPSEDALINFPLYQTAPISSDYQSSMNYWYLEKIECFCVECKKPRIFLHAEKHVLYPSSRGELDPFFIYWFQCTMKKSHEIFFMFKIQDNLITKVGQSPSVSELIEPGLQKYREYLDDKYLQLISGVSLHAGGYGIGSVCYLRRVLEFLIDDAHERAIESSEWDDVKYIAARDTKERIKLLEDFLPGLFVEQRGYLYSILSEGIHNLTEAQCLDIFGTARIVIELTLDDINSRNERENKIKEARKALPKSHRKHVSQKNPE